MPLHNKSREISKLFYNKPFREVRNFNGLSKFRDLISEALIMSVYRHRETLSSEILMYAKLRSFPLVITENVIQQQVQHKMNDLIEEMVFANCLLKVESRRLDVDQMIEIQHRAKRVPEI